MGKWDWGKGIDGALYISSQRFIHAQIMQNVLSDLRTSDVWSSRNHIKNLGPRCPSVARRGEYPHITETEPRHSSP
ncbi:hypothetical protein HBH70_092360 [Parastagonospora nodorum]|nr:hypothetical protein HBH50_131010 [Parastagonospora nodorum]KAH4086829.1 hypothetical protein HBH48_140430 [Parastagonospora nodorum]KAH4410639.1 hypothetical protein HBH92_122130 [Parastagonospora nodorum]KAH4430618.1 hypothetical protein HBH93_153850 [Parastagonospora nodorum]KAH4442836.1 hypothetical protein HBH91_164190 [Parastagonospora nodorum]